VPRSYCYNATNGDQSRVSQAADIATHHAAHTDVSSDCPSEGPRLLPDGTKHSWCYCYDNESRAHARNPVLERARRWRPRTGIGQGDLADDFSPLRLSIYNDDLGSDEGRVPGNRVPRVDAHGNFTYSGDNADRHTVEAMGAVLDHGIRNVTDCLKATGLWERCVRAQVPAAPRPLAVFCLC
jgi:hypothetical protein